MKKYATITLLTISSTYTYGDHYYKRTVKEIYTKNICLGFQNNVSQEWHNILQAAINKYNQTFNEISQLGFCYNPHMDMNPWNATSYISITVDNLGNTGWDGYALYPSRWTRRPGSEILINTYETYKLEYNEKVALFMHEIGHTLGLCHVDESFWCTKIPNTHNNNENSLFRDQAGDNSYKHPTFSETDIEALKYLYPK